MRYQLKNVYISSYNTSGSSAADALPSEDFTIAYTPIEVSYSRVALGLTTGDDDELIFVKSDMDQADVFDLAIETEGPAPLRGLLLPAVQAGGMVIEEDAVALALDDFILV